MAVPDYQTLMLPLLRQTMKREETSIGAIIDDIVAEFGLSADDRAALTPAGGQSLLANRLHWAKTYLQRAGALESTRHGYFRITDRGRKLVQTHTQRVDNSVLEKFPEFVEWRTRSQVSTSTAAEERAEEASPEDQIAQGYKKIQDALAADLIDRIHSAPPPFFERLIVDLLSAMGYGGGRAEAGKALGRSGDGGVDGVINEDALGLDVVYVQAKRYASNSPVPVREIRDFVGSLEGFRATKGVLVTTSSFPHGAIEFSQKVSKRIVLIDGKELSRLLIKFGIGVRTKETYAIKVLDEEYFAE
jgi:restriction system protein